MASLVSHDLNSWWFCFVFIFVLHSYHKKHTYILGQKETKRKYSFPYNVGNFWLYRLRFVFHYQTHNGTSSPCSSFYMTARKKQGTIASLVRNSSKLTDSSLRYTFLIFFMVNDTFLSSCCGFVPFFLQTQTAKELGTYKGAKYLVKTHGED